MAALAGCNDYDEQFDIPSQITAVKKGISIVLKNSDYGKIANNETNKALAESKGPEYVTALANLKETKCFNELITPEEFLPSLISSLYPEADAGSTFTVTYNKTATASAVMDEFSNLSANYTLTAADYETAWGAGSTTAYLTPATVTKIPELLAAALPDAVEGQTAVVNYAYSEFEPSSGGTTPEKTYDTVSDVLNGASGDEFEVKGTVAATYSRGFLLAGDGKYVLVYKSSDVAVGDEVVVSGPISVYGGLNQFTNAAEVTKLQSGSFTYPTAKSMSAADMEAFISAPYVAYVTFNGTLSITTNSKGVSYYNVTIEGTSAAMGSIQYPSDGVVSADLNGKVVTVTGFTVGASSSKYVNVMATSVTEASASGAPLKPAARSSRVASRAGTDANTSVLYVYNGEKWKVYTTSKTHVVVAQPALYDAVGATYISSPKSYLPTYLSLQLPYAKNGDTAAMIYVASSGANPVAVEYTYSNGTWTAAKSYTTGSTTFEKTASGYEISKGYLVCDMKSEDASNPSNSSFKCINLELPEGFENVWYVSSRYGWVASTYKGSANYDGEGWIVTTKAIDLTGATNPKLYLNMAVNYLSSAELSEHLRVMVTTSAFDGENIDEGDWTEMEGLEWTNGSSWTFYDVQLPLTGCAGSQIYLAFAYKGKSTLAPTVEIGSVTVAE